MSMTMILLTVSVGCNLWFLFLLLYDRIMETRFVRFLKGIAGLWRSLDGTEVKQETAWETPPAETSDIIGRAVSGWHPPGQPLPYRRKKPPLRKKALSCRRKRLHFDDGNTETMSRPAQVPEEKLDETFTSIPPSELEFVEDEPEDGTPDTPRATGSSFDEIDDAVRTAKNPEATTAERERAAKVFSDMEGTELYEKLMSGSTELNIRIKGLIEVRLKKPKKEFTVPDNIDEFNIRDYV